MNRPDQPAVRRRAGRGVLATLLALLFAVSLGAGPAHAVSCTGATCKGKNPQTSGCGADARTLAEITYNSLRVELRYSPACHAAWARGTQIGGGAILSRRVAVVGYSCTTANEACRIGHYASADVLDAGEQAYTKMWPFTDFVRACKVYDDLDGAPDRRYGACTTRH